MREKVRGTQGIIIFLLDYLAILGSAELANYLRNGTWSWEKSGMPVENATVICYIFVVYTLVSFFRNTKKNFWIRGLWKELLDVIKEITCCTVILIVTIFLGRMSGEFSRAGFILFYMMAVILDYLLRICFKALALTFKNRSFYTKRLVILTIMDDVDKVLEHLKYEAIWNYKIKGLILLDGDQSMIEKKYHGYQVLGNAGNMYDCLTQRVVDEIFIMLPYDSGLGVGKAVEQYEAMGLTVDLNINIYDLKLHHRNKELRQLGDYYVVTFQESVVDLKMRIVKRVMDIAGAIVGLALTGVITIFLAPALLLESSGPLVFSQTRVGLNGRRFKIYKFRSMYKDAEERKKELMAHNEMTGLMFKMENDPRITKVGKFIRKTSIDELPQFWNVLKGDMSLIGTRPPTVDEFEQYETEYKRRLSIRPGITGMWQATGRSDIKDFENVLALDLEYIDNWSIGLDIKILFLTIFGVFRGRGAE